MKVVLIILVIFNVFMLNYNNRLNKKIERNHSLSKLALYSSYCNNYHIRATWNRVLPHWLEKSKYVMFPPVCEVQFSLERLDAVKYRKNIPKHKQMIVNYDSYFTGKGYDGKKVDLQLLEYNKKLVKEYEKLVKDLLK